MTAGTKGTKPAAKYETPNAAARKAAAAHRRPGLTAANQPTAGPGGAGGGKGTPSGYANPFRNITGLTASRVDQGVDYAGTGPVHAIGPGKVIKAATGNTGWGPPAGPAPGGYIEYELTEGALKGQRIYVAEGITPSVKAGDTVDSGTVIGNMSAPIESGWAAGVGTESQAAQLGQGFSGGIYQNQPTAEGWSFNELLKRLGAPAGSVSGPVQGQVVTTGYAGDQAGWIKWLENIPKFFQGAGNAAKDITEAGHWLGIIGAAITDPHLWISLGWLFLGVFLLFLGAYLLVRLSSAYRSAEGTALKAATAAL